MFYNTISKLLIQILYIVQSSSKTIKQELRRKGVENKLVLIWNIDEEYNNFLNEILNLFYPFYLFACLFFNIYLLTQIIYVFIRVFIYVFMYVLISLRFMYVFVSLFIHLFRPEFLGMKL